MARRGILTFLAALFVAAAFPADAQTLIGPAPALRAMGVSQFGVPRDAKFIFCSGDDCPERTTKTMTVPKPAPDATASQPMTLALIPQLQSNQPPVELSHAKVEPVKKTRQRVVHKKKRPAQLRCGPDEAKK